MTAMRFDAKRVLDVVLVCAALPLVVPLAAIIAVALRIRLGRPILFVQERPGLHERPFRLLKFRTMTSGTDGQRLPLIDANRLTPLGRLVRSTSLDELPELVNVLRGDMSLVGPRPLLMRYLPFFTDAERLRFTVRPGITGLAQVSGRNDLSWNVRLAKDVEYVTNRSLLLDLRILLKTVGVVFRRRGLQVDPGAAMQDLDQERGTECVGRTHVL